MTPTAKGADIVKEERPQYEQIIEKWMLTVSQNGGIQRSDDLHIDRIDEAWRSRSLG
jgi:hypothetical protein